MKQSCRCHHPRRLYSLPGVLLFMALSLLSPSHVVVNYPGAVLATTPDDANTNGIAGIHELVCEEEKGGGKLEHSHGNTDNDVELGGAVVEDEGKSMKCSFRLVMTTSNADPSPQQKLVMEECQSGTCVKAIVYVYNDDSGTADDSSAGRTELGSASTAGAAVQDEESSTAQPEDGTASSSSSSSSSATRRTIESTSTTSDGSSISGGGGSDSGSSNPSVAVPTTVYIRDATYSRPYRQYGQTVADVLDQVPPVFVGRLPGDDQIQSIPHQSSAVLDVTNFLLTLGNVHLEFDQGMGVVSADIWYQLSLSINAYKTAEHMLLHHDFMTILPSYQRDEYLAALYYRTGEAYLTDPQVQHLSEAIEQYTKSRDLFAQLIAVHPHDKLWMNKGYADATAKVGMTKFSELSTESGGGLMMGTTNLHLQHLQTESSSFDGVGGTDFGIGEKNGEEEMLKKAQDMMNGDVAMDAETRTKLQDKIQEILELFDDSIEAYKQYLEPSMKKDFMRLPLWEKQDYYSSMATAYHQAGTAAMMSQVELMKARDYLSNALNLHVNYLLPSFDATASSQGYFGGNDDGGRSEFMEQTTKTSIGDLYLTISNLCLQQGDYPRAKKAYAQTMDWYNTRQMDVPPMTSYESLGIDGDETLQLYLQQLDEYRRMVKAGESGIGGMPRKMNRDTIYEPKVEDEFGSDLYYYERDDGYEGDLLSSIGAVHLSNGDVHRGVEFLEQSLLLYNKDPVLNKRTIADAKINLAMAHFQARHFDESKRIHFEALDTYQELYGDGVNPYIQGLSEQASTTGEKQSQSQDQQQKSSNNIPQIDLEKYRASLLNATSLDDHLGYEL
mmetsp:Transcript_57351/g.139910  ORF Transcript_57351/g.139910 Transcript_57351/m.139910 type:complete len:839 (-) Transcript_57351:2032-4548(-)